MIQRISALLILSCIVFTSCKKNSVSQEVAPSQPIQKGISSTTPLAQGTGIIKDTAGNNVTGYLRLQMTKDAINTDNILISFNPSAGAKYVPGEDAPALQGFGIVTLSSASSDNVPLAINALPLTRQGLSIGLNVYAQNDGIYKLNMLAIQSIPSMYSIWLKDGYRKDSLDMRVNPSYAFNILKADTGSFGGRRFKLVVRLK